LLRRDAEALEFSLDALVAPAGVLLGQADDQLLHVLVECGAAWSTMRVGPGAGDQTAMPAQQRVRPDEEARPARSRQHATDGGEQGPVCRLQPGTWELATQHGELVAQDEDLQILGSFAAAEQGEQLDRAAQVK
jgi:hypothetical protein